jgi:hypothetical protein
MCPHPKKAVKTYGTLVSIVPPEEWLTEVKQACVSDSSWIFGPHDNSEQVCE